MRFTTLVFIFGCLFTSIAGADCTTGSAGTRCFENGQTIWLPKNGGKCSHPGDVRTSASLNKILCINDDGNQGNGKLLIDDLSDYEPEAEPAVYRTYQSEDAPEDIEI